jgi:ferredoxin
MLTVKPLRNYFYSYFYRVDASKCNSCGLCVKLCPQKNVKLDPKELPRWGRNGIFCGHCEMRCREMVHRMVCERRFLFGTDWKRDFVSRTKNDTPPH